MVETLLVVLLNNNITIVNNDIPCRGAFCVDEYQDEMYQIHELCIKFGNSHITLAGEMTSDLVQYSESMLKYLQEVNSSDKLVEIKQLSNISPPW